MSKQLKPGQLCTIDGEVYRCSKRVSNPCSKCHSYYGLNCKTPCNNWLLRNDSPRCLMHFGDTNQEASFPILVVAK